MTDCIFCGIVAGTMPAERVYEDDHTVAFLDIAPACDGHLLVIPRAHSDDIHGADPANLGAVAATVQQMAARVSGALGSDGVLMPWKMARADAQELARIGALLRGE